MNLNLSPEEIKGVLEALQRFPMNQVRPLVTKIETQANAQLNVARTEAAPTVSADKKLLTEVPAAATEPSVNG